MAAAVSGPVKLQVSARRDGDVLLMEYTIFNGLAEPIYVYAVPVDLVARALRPGDAYRDVEPETGTLLLSLIPPPSPVGVDFFQAPTPLSRRVGPGEAFGAEIRVALPLTPWDGYPRIPGDPEDFELETAMRPEVQEGEEDASAGVGLDLQVRMLRFTTGFFPESGLVEQRPGPDPDTFWCDGAFFRRCTVEIPLDSSLPIEI